MSIESGTTGIGSATNIRGSSSMSLSSPSTAAARSSRLSFSSPKSIAALAYFAASPASLSANRKAKLADVGAWCLFSKKARSKALIAAEISPLACSTTPIPYHAAELSGSESIIRPYSDLADS